MLKFFFPAQEDFFKFFERTMAELVKSAEQFQGLLADLDNRQDYATKISAYEQEADKIEEQTIEKLHKTFITPFDRFDIHRLVSKLDDAVDVIERTTNRIVIYQINQVPPEMLQLGVLCVKSTNILQRAVSFLSSLKNATEILKLCDSMKPLEDEAEKLVLFGVAKLFQEEADIKKLLQLKELYESIRSMITGCRTVAVIVKEIVLEYA